MLEVLVPMNNEMTNQATWEKRYQRIFWRLDKLAATIQAQPLPQPQNNPQPPDQLKRLKELVLPYVNHLKSGQFNNEQRRLLSLIEKSIDSHTPDLLNRDCNLSPNESRVAQLVREGRTNQEIATLMGLSKSTVLTHRHHVRVKFGLKNKKVNLRTFLSESNLT